MRVEYNSDKKLVREVKDALRENSGYCPCSIQRTPETKCMCKDFRDKLDDIQFVGACHCGLYVKVEP